MILDYEHLRFFTMGLAWGIGWTLGSWATNKIFLKYPGLYAKRLKRKRQLDAMMRKIGILEE